ncbi:MAG TPA: metallophosphoesterase [Polyangiales bacterium]|nr:metallophosphoesterase [Polyangiales bacterium]
MTLLAHLSDLHLLERGCEKRRGLARQRLAYLSAGVPLDPERRVRQAVFALQTALRFGADHVLVTGDLTEDGERAQFEVLAEVLDRSGVDPADVTLVPGNHDGYAERDAFARALEGPLSAYRATSAPGAHTELADAVIVPVSTVIEGQWFTRSAGQIKAEDVFAVRRLASRPDLRPRAIVVAQHHPVTPRALAVIDWLDGTQNAGGLRELLLERTRLHVLHGHVHREHTRQLCGRSHAQVFAAASVRDSGLARANAGVRLYQAEAGTLRETVLAGPILQPLAAERAQLPAAAAYASA